jgi:hypothetical protein
MIRHTLVAKGRDPFIEGLRAAERIASRNGAGRRGEFPTESMACYQVAQAIRCRIRQETRGKRK